MKKIFAATIILLASAITAIARDVTAIAGADSAYANGEYAEAVAAYTGVASSQGVSSGLYYNIGNAYAKGGDYGNALVYYIRALRLDPSNKEAKSNIHYIEAKVNDANRAELKGKKLSVEPESPTFFSSLRAMISREHLSDTWATWAIVSFLMFMVCATLYVFTRKVAVRKIGFFGGIVCLGITLLTLSFAFMAAGYHTGEGVITGSKVKLRREASLSSQESPAALTRGTRMTVLDSIPTDGKRADWYKVRLNSDYVGWIEASDFKTVDM